MTEAPVSHHLSSCCGALRAVAMETSRNIALLPLERNVIDEKLAALIERPVTSGHLGKWIAAQVFDIELETSAVMVAIDGRFRVGPLHGRSVNVKWYLKRERMVDITESPTLDYYLILTGPVSAAMSSRGGRRPWCIESVYLVDAKQLLDEQRTRGVKIGIASSVRSAQRADAEIYPRARIRRSQCPGKVARAGCDLRLCRTARSEDGVNQ